MKAHRYQSLAAELEQRILNGVMLVGDKLPSVRRLSREKELSPSTVFQAYYQLEAKGLVEATMLIMWKEPLVGNQGS